MLSTVRIGRFDNNILYDVSYTLILLHLLCSPVLKTLKLVVEKPSLISENASCNNFDKPFLAFPSLTFDGFSVSFLLHNDDDKFIA